MRAIADLPGFLETATIEDIEAARREVQTELEAARRKADAAAIAYASTPDGAAETYRRFEMAADQTTRKELKSTCLAGLAMANQEYLQRQSLGNAGPNDGPLEVIPTGSLTEPIEPLIRALIEQRIMGTYRSSTTAFDTERVQATLMRLEPDGKTRHRLRIQTPAPSGIFTATLAEVITNAFTDTTTHTRLLGFFGDAAETITATIAPRNPQ